MEEYCISENVVKKKKQHNDNKKKRCAKKQEKKIGQQKYGLGAWKSLTADLAKSKPALEKGVQKSVQRWCAIYSFYEGHD